MDKNKSLSVAYKSMYETEERGQKQRCRWQNEVTFLGAYIWPAISLRPQKAHRQKKQSLMISLWGCVFIESTEIKQNKQELKKTHRKFAAKLWEQSSLEKDSSDDLMCWKPQGEIINISQRGDKWGVNYWLFFCRRKVNLCNRAVFPHFARSGSMGLSAG